MSSDDWIVQMVPSGKRLTAQQLHGRASQVARLLRDTGTQRVAFLTESRLECAELMLGARWAGADYILSGTDHLLTGVRLAPQSLLEILQSFDPTVIIISDTHHATATWLHDKLPPTVQCLMMGSIQPGWDSYEVARDRQSSAPLEHYGVGEFYPASGGSSGRPRIIKRPVRLDGQPSAIQHVMTPGANGVTLVAGPLYHTLHAGALLAGLLSGAKVAILEHWDAQAFLQSIQDFKVTHVNIVLSMMVRLLQMPPGERDKYDLSSLRQVLHTASPCPDDIKRQFIDWFGDRLVEVYGMTERFGGTVISAAEWLQRPGSAGRPFPGCQIIIRDEAGKRLPAGETGIIWFKQEVAHSAMVYLGEPDVSAACYNKYGETTVRDMGYVDAEGFLYITGRAKRMIVVGGVNVYPEATEKLLAGQKEVADAWVFGRPDETFGERLQAFVQLQPGVKQTKQLTERLAELSEAQLGMYASPTKFIFVDTLPRNEAGKMNAKQISALEAEYIKKAECQAIP